MSPYKRNISNYLCIRKAAPLKFPETPEPFLQAQCLHTHSPDRIQMDIPAKLRTIKLRLDKDGFESSLKQMSGTFVVTVLDPILHFLTASHLYFQIFLNQSHWTFLTTDGTRPRVTVTRNIITPQKSSNAS